MCRLIAGFCLIVACSQAFAAKEPAVTKAFVDSRGVHIITADGRDHTIEPRKWQAGGGSDEIEVAPDGRTVGWLVNQMLTPLAGAANYSYAVAVELDIWRDGRVVRKFSAGQAIRNWMFLKQGDEAAFHTGPLHGQEFYDCTLFDVNTGKQISHWALERKDYVVPDWVKPLLANDPLPGPDEISNWVEDHSEAKKAAPPAKQ
jgi:hypothetical protein